MSCAFRALPRLIPEIMLAAPRGSELIIVSPWIRELTLKPPVVGTQGHWNSSHEMRLSQFLLFIVERLNLHLSLVVREFDKDVQHVLRYLQKRAASSFQVIEESYLHAKVIATDYTILQTSANLIPTSLYRNVETCALSTNRYTNARKYIQAELKIRL
jgi:hypothetical protein